MAYRRKTRRGKKSRKGGTNRRLSKHMVRAIKAISQIPVETKSYPQTNNFGTWLSLTGYTSGVSHIMRANVFSDVPRAKNSITKSETSFIGDSFNARGFRWSMHAYVGGSALKADTQFRFSVYKENGYASGPTTLLSGNYIFDQDQNTTPTWLFWNPQVATIIYRRTFTLHQNGQLNKMLNKKFYIPLRKKVTSAHEESVAINSYMEQIKGMQYYWVLEMLSVGGSDLDTIGGTIGTRLYFKDA